MKAPPPPKCEKCQYTDCFSLHDYVASDCRLQTCDICPDLSKLDIEIAETHNKLVELAKRRRTLKSLINHRHERLIHHLPVELVSKIFIHFTSDFWNHRSSVPPVLLLGGVCKMWRDVTLGTPQLWTGVKFSVKHRYETYNLDVATEWLRRSHSLPLSIIICLQDDSNLYLDCSRLYPVIALVRSHSSRWKNLRVDVNKACLLQTLLNGLEDKPVDLESLSVGWCSKDRMLPLDARPVLCPRHISQSRTASGGMTLSQLPCSFERLTDLSMDCMPIDELLYIIKNSPNLVVCRTTFVEESEQTFDMPSSPIISHSIILLETNNSPYANVLPYLTLPSLKILEYEYKHWEADDPDIDDLANFLQRSSPPLQKFNLTVEQHYHADDTYCALLPSVTCVDFDMRLEEDSLPRQSAALEGFLETLAENSGISVFPNLRELHLRIPEMTPHAWSTLCDVIQKRSMEYATESSTLSEPSDQRDVAAQDTTRYTPLKSVFVNQTNGLIKRITMTKAVFDKFVELEKVGITIMVANDSRDVIAQCLSSAYLNEVV